MKLSRPIRQDLNRLYRDEVERDWLVHREVDEERVLVTLGRLLWPEEGDPEDYAYLGECIDEVARDKFLRGDYKSQTRAMEVEVEVHGQTGDDAVDSILQKDSYQRWLMRIYGNGSKPQSVLTERATPKQHRKYGSQQLQRARELGRRGNWHLGVSIISEMSGADPDVPASQQGILEIKAGTEERE